jgi:hypothetical protein
MNKPKLVFFQYRYDPALPPFLLTHAREHVKCLAGFFDVTVVSDDCDYRQVCDRYEPDVTLFESGVNHDTCRRPQITHTDYAPQVPKLGLHHGDGFCNARAGFLSDMDRWGIETFFSIAVTMAEHTPAIADRLFAWPVFVDPSVYRDYGLRKNIPVLFTGNRDRFYPWRQDILRLLSRHYPVLICPHPGYEPNPVLSRIVVGEEYAAMLNASWFVPACGTVAKEVVRKHFEVPACGACLVTERSPALEAAGFVDMENCVFADRSDVLDKISRLFKEPDLLASVLAAGRELVHSRHTLYHRDQMLQWFLLHKAFPGQKIIQPGPFSPLRAVPDGSDAQSGHIRSGGRHLALLGSGDEELARGRYLEAERLYLQCVNYMRWMPEPKLKLALCALYKGSPKLAVSYLEEPLEFILGRYDATDPDPVEWAYLIISRLCLGDHAAAFPWLHHPELHRARWAAGVLAGVASPRVAGGERPRASIHHLPARSFDEWVGDISRMLVACGQEHSARALRERAAVTAGATGGRAGDAAGATPGSPATASTASHRRYVAALRHRGPRQARWRRVTWNVGRLLHRLEERHGYFLPYRWSASRNDEFFETLRNVVRGANVEAALAIGLRDGGTSTAAFLAGLRQNGHAPAAYCVTALPSPATRRSRERDGDGRVRWYALPSLHDGASPAIAQTVERIKSDAHLRRFPLVFLSGPGLAGADDLMTALSADLAEAEIVILEDLSVGAGHQVARHLLERSDYELVAHNPALRQGYSVFVRATRAEGRSGADGSPAAGCS